MILMDPSATPEANVHSLLTKAANKWRYKPNHLYVIAAANAGGGTELTSDNITQFLRDGLIVLASNMSKLNPNALLPQTSNSPETLPPSSHGDEPHPAATSSSLPAAETSGLERTTDSGSCSSVEMDEQAERASIKSFDSDSLYSFHSAAPMHGPNAGFEETKEDSPQQQLHSHQHQQLVKQRRNWRSMLPQISDQLGVADVPVSRLPPMHSTPLVQPTPNFQPTVPHTHSSHQCKQFADGSSSSPLPPRVPSIMEQLAPSTVICSCCDAGCAVETATPSAQQGARCTTPLQQPRTSSPVTITPTQLSSAVATPASSSPLLLRSHSTPAPPPAASASPPLGLLPIASSPTLHHSHSQTSLDHLRMLELEKTNRRLDASLKAYLKSDVELRARVASLSAGADMLPSLSEEFKLLKLTLDQKEKEHAKILWERDRLKTKNAMLMTRNNELKEEAQQLAVLQKEHEKLQQAHARLGGHNVNAQTSPTVLQELLLHHTNAISRVHGQMSQNVLREKKELQEARQCKICMSRPSDTILLPCSHFVLCGTCAHSIKVCPICRSSVHDKRPVYT